MQSSSSSSSHFLSFPNLNLERKTVLQLYSGVGLLLVDTKQMNKFSSAARIHLPFQIFNVAINCCRFLPSPYWFLHSGGLRPFIEALTDEDVYFCFFEQKDIVLPKKLFLEIISHPTRSSISSQDLLLASGSSGENNDENTSNIFSIDNCIVGVFSQSFLASFLFHKWRKKYRSGREEEERLILLRDSFLWISKYLSSIEDFYLFFHAICYIAKCNDITKKILGTPEMVKVFSLACLKFSSEFIDHEDVRWWSHSVEYLTRQHQNLVFFRDSSLFEKAFFEYKKKCSKMGSLGVQLEYVEERLFKNKEKDKEKEWCEQKE